MSKLKSNHSPKKFPKNSLRDHTKVGTKFGVSSTRRRRSSRSSSRGHDKNRSSNLISNSSRTNTSLPNLARLAQWEQVSDDIHTHTYIHTFATYNQFPGE